MQHVKQGLTHPCNTSFTRLSTMSMGNHSIYHLDRPCGPCVLCGKTSKYYSHWKAWGEREREFTMRFRENEPDATSCICLAHFREAQRQHPATFVPRWKQPKPVKHKCINPSCTAPPTEKLICTSSAPIHELESFLKVKCSSDQPFLLCNKHYQSLHKAFQAPASCSCCGIQPKRGKRLNRHCPDLLAINAILCREEEISESDVICLSCYKCHLAISKESIDPQRGSNGQLENFVTIWQHKHSEPSTDKLTRCI